ncbi:MAG: RsmB/NOP family class I SAM-dependent RNA methyltransferase [Lachnospiraceae bacterium]|nr:RsmB/NOP family class I SAM-dependent RNA methyltransferase [Lachnospiraceae bacterium]
MDLPQKFLERMEKVLGDEYDDFLQTYHEPRRFGLRVNTLKISVEEFVKLAPFHLTRIPWIDNGFYYEKEDDPARHPFYYAGLYYLQEPSAMTPASILPVTPGEYVLDLCAAPGGKATALAAKLQGQGLLVANDISASRAKALLKNLEVFGVKNSFVANAVPLRLAQQFPETFDKILVDAPCSGEGMFRKDMANAKAWSLEKVEACARIQRDITRQAVTMLRPGGLMLYSTCTFAPEENEGTIAYLLQQCPDMELVEIPHQEGFARGEGRLLDLLKEKNTETSRELQEAGVWEKAAGERSASELKKCVRIFPHKMGGEGHFLALLKKKGELSGMHQRALPGGGRLSKEEDRVLREFLKDVTSSIRIEQIEVRGGQAYFIPEPPQIKGKIPFLRNGLYLGEIRKNRFEPSQSLAMALKKEEYASVLDFSYGDPRVRRYLCGETVDAEDLEHRRDKGWQLVCVGGYPLGWGKLVNGTLKNKYHPGWQMKQ